MIDWMNRLGNRYGGALSVIEFVSLVCSILWFVWSYRKELASNASNFWDRLGSRIGPARAKYLDIRIRGLKHRVSRLESFGDAERDETIAKLIRYAHNAAVSFVFVMASFAMLVPILVIGSMAAILEREILRGPIPPGQYPPLPSHLISIVAGI